MCVLAWMHLYVWLCALSADVNVSTCNLCAYACPFLCLHAHLSFLHAHMGMNISMFCSRLDAHLYLHGSVTVYLFGACVQNRYESVLRFHKWTLDLLGTRWRPANLAFIVYPSLYTTTGMAEHVYSHFSAASRPGKSHLKKTICLVCSSRFQVQESLQVEVFPVCFWEDVLNLNFAVSQSFAVKSSNLKRWFVELNLRWNYTQSIAVTCVCILKQQINCSQPHNDFAILLNRFVFPNCKVETPLVWFFSNYSITHSLNSNICIHYKAAFSMSWKVFSQRIPLEKDKLFSFVLSQ